MSGGDLDGDVYMCIWDKEILSGLTQDKIEPPAVYKKFIEEDQPDSDEIVDHMKNYFERDNLGHLAHLHLALCD